MEPDGDGVRLVPYIPTLEQCARVIVSRGAAERFGWTTCETDASQTFLAAVQASRDAHVAGLLKPPS